MKIQIDPRTGEQIFIRKARCECGHSACIATNDSNYAQLKNGECTGLDCPACRADKEGEK